MFFKNKLALFSLVQFVFIIYLSQSNFNFFVKAASNLVNSLTFIIV